MVIQKLIGIMMICLILSMTFVTGQAKADRSTPTIVATSAISIDADSGLILYDKNANKRGYPASITKVMTALLLMEHVKKGDVITLSHNCVIHPKSNAQVFFQHGEKLTRRTALFTMLTISANDVACGIGEHISGTEADFGQLMTEKAKSLGAMHTQFRNASGLHDAGHYTTAYDMALITKEAIKNKLILQAMNTEKYTIHTNFQQNRVVYRHNKRYENPNSIGEKTGYTDQARNTLIEVDQKDGFRVITVILGANKHVTKTTNFEDARKISDYALSQLKKVNVINKNSSETSIDVLGKQVPIIPQKTLRVDEKKNSNDTPKISFVPEIKQPSLLYKDGINKGEVLGRYEVKIKGNVVGSVNGIATKAFTFKKPISKAKVKGVDTSSHVMMGFAFVLLLITSIIYISIAKRKRMKNKNRAA